MSNKSDELAELLVKITLSLYELREPCDVSDLLKRSTDTVHVRAAKGVFDAIRIAIMEEGPEFWVYYDMSHLLDMLPLYAIYHITPIVAIRIGGFLAELAVLRDDVSFNFNAWSRKNMLEIYNASENIRAHIAAMRHEDETQYETGGDDSEDDDTLSMNMTRCAI